MVRALTHREPAHPGEILLEDFLHSMGLTQRQLAHPSHRPFAAAPYLPESPAPRDEVGKKFGLAEGTQVPHRRANELINGRRGIAPSTALRLPKIFGNTAGF